MKSILLSTLFLASSKLFAQTSYSGFIDNYPIELVTSIYSKEYARAVYVYTDFDEPIAVNGELQNKNLTLVEKDKAGNKKAILSFDNFDEESDQLEGKWTDLHTGKQRHISLKKLFTGSNENSTEILQSASLGDKYFKLIFSNRDGLDPGVTSVKIFQKKTDKLLQEIALDCQLRGVDDIGVGDYNFDGLADFSLCLESYAGPNTTRRYFLYDKAKRIFFDSGFGGTSLEFDGKKKRIFEYNQCCAVRSVTTAEYKIVNNKMVVVAQHCYKWDEKKKRLAERKMKDCQ